MNMNLTRTFVVALSAVLIPNMAHAFYAAHMGRFTTRDPFGEMLRIGSEVFPPSSSVGLQPGFIARDQFRFTPGYADGYNLYQYVQSDPIMRFDPSGQKSVTTCGEYCSGYSQGGFWSVVSSHTFLGIDGVGRGFFEVNNNPCGKGKWRDDDFAIYPKDPKAPWYSVCIPINVDDECFDPTKFCNALKNCVKNAAANPGRYCVGIKDCRTSARGCIQQALIDSFKGPLINWVDCQNQSGWFPNPSVPTP
jgi:hypothetical protein